MLSGFVVSDYDAWAEIWGTHHQGGDAEGGAAKGLNAGIDQEGGGHSAIDQLAQVRSLSLSLCVCLPLSLSLSLSLSLLLSV